MPSSRTGAQESEMRLKTTKLTKPIGVELDSTTSKNINLYQRELAKIGMIFTYVFLACSDDSVSHCHFSITGTRYMCVELDYLVLYLKIFI